MKKGYDFKSLGLDELKPQKIQENPAPARVEKIKIPSWYKRRERLNLKKFLVAKLLKEYCEPVQIDKTHSFMPTDQDIKDYTEQLNSIKKLKDLLSIDELHTVNPDYSLLDRIRKLSRKKAVIISIYMKSGNKVDYVCSNYKRFASIKKRKYLMLPNTGIYDAKHRMMTYSFFEDNPMPIIFEHSIGIKTHSDTMLLEKTMRFEFAQQMAEAAKLTSRINLTLIFVVITLLICGIHLIWALKNAGVF